MRDNREDKNVKAEADGLVVVTALLGALHGDTGGQL